MTRTEIAEMQRRIGTTPDGWWGPKSIAACQAHLRALMPKPSPWPATSQAALTAFYGAPGAGPLVKVDFPWRMKLYDGPQTTAYCFVHSKVAASFERVLALLLAAFPSAESRAIAGIDRFFGSYVNRAMRGGSLPSMHARGAAVDFDATRNSLWSHWPTRAHMPIEVMECFAVEGWVAAGAFWGRDAMHFEASKI